jgi:hypothetical protein
VQTAPTLPTTAAPELVPPCPLFEALFEQDRVFTYRFTDAVDTHAPAKDGPQVARTDDKVGCKVIAVESDDGSLRTELECTDTSGAHPILDLDGFRYRDEKLWWGSFPFPDEEPWLDCEPRASYRKLPDPPDTPGRACSLRISADPDLGWCRTLRCRKGGYGGSPSLHRVCVAPGRGLTLQEGKNLEGPRVTRWRLTRAHPDAKAP